MDHVSTEDLGAYLSNGLDASERVAIEQHLTICSDCRMELIEGQRAISTAPSIGTRPRNTRWAYSLAGLAAAAAIAVMIWPRGDETASITPVERNNDIAKSAALGSVAIVSPAANGIVTDANPVFTWRKDDGSSYKVTLTDSAGSPLWSASTTDTTAAVPANIQLSRGEKFFWYVDALRPGGQSLTSGVKAFRTSR